MNEELIQFLDRYGLLGDYSGGGDQGGIDTFETEIEVPKDEPIQIDMEALQEWVYKHTLSKYGGWDGGFDASGVIEYNKETKCIEVSGSESDDDNLKTVKQIEIPLAKYFTNEDRERVSRVFIEAHHYESEVLVRLQVENGPWTKSLQKAENAIRKFITTQVKPYDEDEGYRYHVSQEFLSTATVELDIDEIVTISNEMVIDLNLLEFTNKIEPEES